MKEKRTGGNKVIKYNGLNIFDSFSNCCDTCKHRPFQSGYSGRKNCGYCEEIKHVVCRSCVCTRHVLDEKAIKSSIGGMKGQSRWIKEKLDREEEYRKKGII
jgi:hypothetical protein